MPWPQWRRQTESASDEHARRRAAFSEVHEKLPGLKAFFILSPGGTLVDCVTDDSKFDVRTFAAEYGTVLRLLLRAFKDSGVGEVQEELLITTSCLIFVQHFPNGQFAVSICSPGEHSGRVRYELKRSLLYSSLSNL